MFIAMIGFIVGTVIKSANDVYPDVKTKSTCDSKLSATNKTCGIWYNNVCLKGTCNTCTGGGTECDKPSDNIVIGLLVVAKLSFILFIIFLVLGFVNK